MIRTLLSINKQHIIKRCFLTSRHRVDIADVLQKYDKSMKWDSIREDVYQIHRQINATNIDSILVDTCLMNKDYDLALSYIDHLSQTQSKLSLVVQSKLMKIYSILHKEQITDKAEKKIIDLYNQIKSNYDVVDVYTNENIISALSLTDQWKTCIKHLNEVKITSNPTDNCYNRIVVAAFKNNDLETGLKLLNEMIDNRRNPSEESYQTYLNAVKSYENEKFVEHLENLFEFLSTNDIVCTADTINVLKSIVDKKLKCNPCNIDKKGNCSMCEDTLDRMKISNNDYEKLKSAFFEKVLIGKNIFCKSSPNEVKRFQEFLSQNKKYDVVVDGLNVAYAAGSKNGIHFQAFLLASVVKHFAANNKKILVLGRTHMNKWSKKYMGYIHQNADTFLAQDLSHDDPFLLYCALNSGLHTIIVTRDLMRSHLYLLKDIEMKRLFSRWFSQAQFYLNHVDQGGNAYFKYPLPYLKTSQKTGRNWHIPYTDKIPNDNTKWLCIEL